MKKRVHTALAFILTHLLSASTSLAQLVSGAGAEQAGLPLEGLVDGVVHPAQPAGVQPAPLVAPLAAPLAETDNVTAFPPEFGSVVEVVGEETPLLTHTPHHPHQEFPTPTTDNDAEVGHTEGGSQQLLLQNAASSYGHFLSTHSMNEEDAQPQ